MVRDHWRRAERERRATRRAVVGRSSADERAAQPDTELRTLVQALPDGMRAVVLLHYYADFPVREIAALLNRKEGTVKSDLHRTRVRLRDELEGLR